MTYTDLFDTDRGPDTTGDATRPVDYVSSGHVESEGTDHRAAPVDDRVIAQWWNTDAMVETGEYPPLFAVMGAHPWAGATTLSRMWAPAADTGMQWPANPATTQLTLVVAQQSARGLRAASAVLQMLSEDTVPPGVLCIGLAVVAAGPGRAPKEVLSYQETVGELVNGRVYPVPYIPELVSPPPRLASWRPGDERRRKSGPVSNAVPTAIADVGMRICLDLVELHPNYTPPERTA